MNNLLLSTSYNTISAAIIQKPPSPHGEFKNVPLKLDFHNAVGTSQKTSIVGKLISTPHGHIVISINAAAENTSWKIDLYMR